ncbi:hypothetical protein AJ80_03567 [Polytolypa hystricis UAMH7299]|uniref:Uncharacterized protein n=1 Tax=Polytolypa hystricis (strain UAMH7299) TaxID=1447883 RepID=A0A2B7YHS9_POLH7|nr:hypothetical protein AJ80_03567 [Polytolypa hystricis UAMH7299]
MQTFMSLGSRNRPAEIVQNTKANFSLREGRVKVVGKTISHRNRPRIRAGLGAAIESAIDNFDRDPYVYAQDIVLGAGVYKTQTTKAVYSQTGIGEASTRVSPLQATARGPNFSVSAQAGWLSSRASIGPDGVSLEVLGFGFSVGPELAIETPIADVRCTVM